MKKYVNEKYQVAISIPDEWRIQSGNYPFIWKIFYILRLGYIPTVNIEFANDKIETCNINITVFDKEPSPKMCEYIFLSSNTEGIYENIEFGRIIIRNKEHTTVKYKFHKGIWAKKYMIIEDKKGYAITTSFFKYNMFLERETIWDEVARSIIIGNI